MLLDSLQLSEVTRNKPKRTQTKLIGVASGVRDKFKGHNHGEETLVDDVASKGAHHTQGASIQLILMCSFVI
jgi:hypothetical protein